MIHHYYSFQVKDANGLADMLAELGMSDSKDLSYAEDEIVLTLSTFLKPIATKRFLSEMGR